MVNQTNVVGYLEAALKAAGVRGKAIASNLANLNTPGFRRSSVEFEKYLAEAMKSKRPIDVAEIQAKILQPMTTPVDGQGNDVSLEMEIGDMIRNGALYKTYVRLLSKLYDQMEFAINGQ